MVKSNTGKLKLIDPEDLHCHEEIDERQVARVLQKMKETRLFHPPLLVDDRTQVVLDGHHRLMASKRLGCKKIPCFCVDYLADDSVVLESWRPDVRLTKQQVIDMGLSGTVFPLKTTRHVYVIPASIKPTPLAELSELSRD
jgi:ParB-like chromosome segregation protein Spo0J